MKKSFFAALCLVPLISSCASAPDQKEIAAADYGSPVSANDCEQLATSLITKLMKDPESVKFDNFTCSKGWEGKVPIAGAPSTYGYRFTGLVNAKNSFGGYTGSTPFKGIVRDDGNGARVVRYCIVDDEICMPRMIN